MNDLKDPRRQFELYCIFAVSLFVTFVFSPVMDALLASIFGGAR